MRQIVYDFWKVNSVVSVHRSNNRHIVKIAKENILTQTIDLIDGDIIPAELEKKKKKCRPTDVFHPCHIKFFTNPSSR